MKIFAIYKDNLAILGVIKELNPRTVNDSLSKFELCLQILFFALYMSFKKFGEELRLKSTNKNESNGITDGRKRNGRNEGW